MELGLTMQAAKNPDSGILNRKLSHNSPAFLQESVAWLSQNSGPRDWNTFRKFAMESASTKTHPRHIMDARRLLTPEEHETISEVASLSGKMLAGIGLDVSEETRLLGIKALSVIEQDNSPQFDDRKIIKWAAQVAKDFVSRAD